MLRKQTSLVGLLAAVALLAVGCGGPMEEGEPVEQGLQGQALTSKVTDPTAPVQDPALGDGSTAQNVTVFGSAANLPNRGAVADSQDPIPITNDGRPVTGGGSGGNPDPGDPNAYRPMLGRSNLRH